jgi:UPF0716 protein FxsA
LRYLLLSLLLLPILELGVFLIAGNIIGIPETLFIVIGTGLLGAYLLKRQGLRVIRTIQDQLRFGQVPGDAILDGFCILIGGILLLLPGFLTDIIGAIVLFTPSRKILKKILIKSMQRKIQKKHRVTIIN